MFALSWVNKAGKMATLPGDHYFIDGEDAKKFIEQNTHIKIATINFFDEEVMGYELITTEGRKYFLTEIWND